MPNGGPDNVYTVYCRHCGTENLFGEPSAYSKVRTGGTGFICSACGEPAITLWEYLSTSRPFPPTEGSMRLCRKCGTAYNTWVTFKGRYCFFCGSRLEA